jgi:hypothetical protein
MIFNRKIRLLSNFKVLIFGTLIFLAPTQANELLKRQASPQAVSITPDTVNLSAEIFFASLMSSSEVEKNNAMLYMLGVLDATEKKTWCSYKTLKTTTLREFAYEYFKKLPKYRLKERASVLIEEALHQTFSCKRKGLK